MPTFCYACGILRSPLLALKALMVWWWAGTDSQTTWVWRRGTSSCLGTGQGRLPGGGSISVGCMREDKQGSACLQWVGVPSRKGSSVRARSEPDVGWGAGWGLGEARLEAKGGGGCRGSLVPAMLYDY